VLSAADYAKPVTPFVGYRDIVRDTRISQISPRFGKDGLTTGDFQVCLEESPFYAESGGQVGDTGRIFNDEFEFEVINTWKEMGLIWQDCKLVRMQPSAAGLSREEISSVLQTGTFFRHVRAEVDAKRRRDITRNHTATHLLHAALREVLGKHVTQAGSLVAPDRLRFDFTHGHPMAPEEVRKVEELVNERIAEATAVAVHDNVPLGEARKRGAMMLFGEKYGDSVRMIEVPGFSLELCGGCHVPITDEIGLFKITGESSSASGVRRIEAVTGFGAYRWVQEQQQLLTEAARSLKTTPKELPKAIERIVSQAKSNKKETSTVGEIPTRVDPTTVSGLNLYIYQAKNVEMDAAKSIADKLVESDPVGVAVVAIANDGRTLFFCKAAREAQSRGANAGTLVKSIAGVAGGTGGGSPQFGQASVSDGSKVAQALDSAAAALGSQIQS
jgi:alanyl-tRNA synthetase